jgi:hypothetical protein
MKVDGREIHKSITEDLVVDAVERHMTSLDNPGFCIACGAEAKSPEIGSTYAVSGDGVGKVTVEGVTLFELFGEKPWPTKQPDGSWA